MDISPASGPKVEKNKNSPKEAQQPHQRSQYEAIKEQLYGCLCRLRIQEFPYDWEEGATRWAQLPSSSEK
uniref:Uncharacterized protein n=1 Tax=Globodera rostochiensis TaxID=31243 RepID=A0A914H788_GLORO